MAYTANHLRSRATRRFADFDPDATTATIVDFVPGTGACRSLIGVDSILVGIVRTVGTGALTSARIVVADAIDGTGNLGTVAAAALLTADAVGDFVWIEATGEQIKAACVSTSLYWGVEIALVTGSDECIVYFEEYGRFAYNALTADYIQ